MKRFFRLDFIICLFFIWTAPLFADETAAKAAFLRGINMLKNRDFEEATKAFEDSVAEHPNPNALFNLGLCHFELERYFEAKEAFEQLIKRFSDKLDEDKKTIIDEKRAEIERLIPRLEIASTPEDATIIVDGNKINNVRKGEPILLPKGTHRIEVIKQGFETITREIHLKTADHNKEVFQLQRRTGNLSMTVSEPSAVVYIEGKQIGTTPLSMPIALPDGRYQISVAKEGFENVTKSVQMIDAQTMRLNISLIPIHSSTPPPAPMPWYKTSPLRLIISASGTVVMSATTAGFWAATLKKQSDYSDKNDSLDYENGGEWNDKVVSSRDRDKELAKKYNRTALVTTAFAGAFAAWALTELIVFKLGGKKKEREHLAWAPNSMKVRF